jgi:hypothetical protein
MKILGLRAHGYLDYVAVAGFLAAPSLISFAGLPAMIAYALACVHLLLTLTTAFPLGVLRLVPFTAHGAIELVVAIALALLPWLLGFSGDPAPRNFYAGAGAVLFLVWLTTDYRAEALPPPRRP